ncbi:MAG: bifunctional pantoate--beta-alanine ligase/(d)CMP kinase [Leptolyngbyaceae cyanobacterium RU_5_1]|nr:bifunctional pantoate--beta-alanine ligase/(d)CMP kinase [Leptolyngbyaceae cyanobacterium RU_5_1]
MYLFTSIAGLRCYLDAYRYGQPKLGESAIYERSPIEVPLDVGFVPTMGALHTGHLSLIQRARRENKIVVVSIFVNPLQFGPNEDLQRYPRTLELDKTLCEAAEVDVLFVPSAQEMGIVGVSALTQVVPPETMTSSLCGRSRTGHFQGVATIVTKLFNIVQPTRAYFGQKDAQQLAIIRQLVTDLNLPVEIVGCPTVRELSGLALSSRNQYLTTEEREQAATLYRGLQQAEQKFRAGERSSDVLIGVVKTELAAVTAIAPEYVELVHPTTLEPLQKIEDAGLMAIAVRFGSTRLIDNILLSNRKPIVAIDGPAGAGKSTVARLVAQSLGLFYLDTGAMYRALTWLVLQAGVEIEDAPAIAELVSQCRIEFREQENNSKFKIQNSKFKIPSIWINGHDVTQAIRSLEVTAKVSEIAAQPAVRRELMRQQQRYGQQGGIVIEGRDIGTQVFPDAELKIFLTASVQERARRRQKDLQNQGIADISLDELEQAIYERDRKDSTRVLAPLCKAADAIALQTDGLTITEVIEQIVSFYHEKLATYNHDN